jgi:hypothetical protein
MLRLRARMRSLMGTRWRRGALARGDRVEDPARQPFQRRLALGCLPGRCLAARAGPGLASLRDGDDIDADVGRLPRDGVRPSGVAHLHQPRAPQLGDDPGGRVARAAEDVLEPATDLGGGHAVLRARDHAQRRDVDRAELGVDVDRLDQGAGLAPFIASPVR